MTSSAEKPYEHLSSSEKDIFNVCGEIIKYKWGELHSPELLKLRERATNLFAKMRNVDLSEHDSYYKLIAEANELRKEFQEIKSQPTEHKYIDSPGDINNAEGIASKLVGELKSSKSVNTWFEWIPADQDLNPYGDMTGIYISYQGESDELELSFTETISRGESIGSSHVKEFYRVFNPKNADLQQHKHEGLDAFELWLTMKDLSEDQVREAIINFVEIMRENPRTREDDLG